MPFLYLLYYHKADVTSQTFGRSRQNDVLHDAFQSIGHVSPKTGRPAPGGDPTSREIIKRRRGRLQPTIIEDGVYFWQCCPPLCALRSCQYNDVLVGGWVVVVGL